MPRRGAPCKRASDARADLACEVRACHDCTTMHEWKCPHQSFTADASVIRLTDKDDGPVTGFSIDVRVTCDMCGSPFVFRGPTGLSPRQPMVSFDGLTLRAPIAPQHDPTFGEDGLDEKTDVDKALRLNRGWDAETWRRWRESICGRAPRLTPETPTKDEVDDGDP